ncbi:MAG: hypothetical protein P1U56_04750 [Saprospiraceae bacterium]|nr:hypothetical protein [Saprospiraceae bacterium]
MNFFKNLFGGKNKIELSEEELLEVGACPNCWGKQEYNDEYVAYQKDQTKANINKDKQHQKAFVQQYIETGITGIQLKREGEYLTCPKCNTKHKYVSSKAN